VTEAKLVYMDTSALVKLVIPEPETEALIAVLTPQTRMVASEIIEVEAIRAARRAGGHGAVDTARDQLAGVRCLPLTRDIRRRASELEPDTLPSLDAIHIATALDLGERLDCVYAYDTRMTAAAEAVGLRTCAPTAELPAEESDISPTDS
jgi:predicted nucleic acid-binding protein